MTTEITELAFLRQEGLTTKDKFVLLADHFLPSDGAKELAEKIGLSTASVRQSLAKGGRTDLAVEGSEIRQIEAALMDVCRMSNASMRDKDWKHLRSVAADLHSAGATPLEVHLRAAALRLRLRLPVTLGSLDKYWAQLDSGSPWSPGRVYGG